MIDRIADWLKSAEAWLDARGKPAWIAAMVIGFVFVWPIGLAILLYMIWSNRMSCKSRWRSRHARFAPTGNAAFDEYRAETLRRLEEEQTAFTAFLDRLRKAKDKAEFEQFMAERRTAPGGNGDAVA
ncbi:MAG: DUF2852 domain-containing protein [Alphaproteobacteria bacterium]|nr:MAG: DUF2852 domain-containing protein [Alphaproteobacteria bacterium]